MDIDSQKKDTFQVLNLEKIIDNTSQFSNKDKQFISSISDSIVYIVLGSKNDKGEEIFVNNALQTFVGEKYIILNCWDKILQFDRVGKFIRQIERKGQGPGDYIMVSNIDVNEASDRVCINNSEQSMLVYDFQGRFIQNIPFRDAGYFAVLDNGRYALAFDNLRGNISYRMIIQDEKADTLALFENYVKFPFKNELFL